MVGSGEVPEWPKGADCKSAGVSLRRFESSPLHMNSGDHYVTSFDAGIAQLARASAFQAEGRGFESRFPLQGCVEGVFVGLLAHVAQWWSTSLVRKRPSVQSRSWACLYYRVF